MAAVSLGGIVALAACGSAATTGASGPSAAPSATAAKASSPGISCAQITSLRTALTSLGHATVNLESLDQIAADLATVEHDLSALNRRTATAFSAQESQLTAAFDKIGDDVRTLAGDPSPANLTALEGAVKNLRASTRPVIAKIKAVCPSS